MFSSSTFFEKVSLGVYLTSLFFMRFMLNTKKTIVTAAIHAKLSSRNKFAVPVTNPLVRFTTWVKGRKIWATVCTMGGNCERGKKVPLSRNMGVTSKNAG